jgi:hypothetical protein
MPRRLVILNSVIDKHGVIDWNGFERFALDQQAVNTKPWLQYRSISTSSVIEKISD